MRKVLKHQSVANLSQLTVADRRRLREKAGAVTGAVMSKIEDGLKLVLGM